MLRIVLLEGAHQAPLDQDHNRPPRDEGADREAPVKTTVMPVTTTAAVAVVTASPADEEECIKTATATVATKLHCRAFPSSYNSCRGD